jgi:hypothetical protein
MLKQKRFYIINNSILCNRISIILENFEYNENTDHNRDYYCTGYDMYFHHFSLGVYIYFYNGSIVKLDSVIFNDELDDFLRFKYYNN